MWPWGWWACEGGRGVPSVLDKRLNSGLVATNPIKQIGSGASSPVAFAQPVGNFVGNRLGNGKAVNARRGTWGGP